MRSANKKHGNIGDIEFLEGPEIVESWDAKFGKAYLRDELEELNEKLEYHHNVRMAGFVTSGTPLLNTEICSRINEIQVFHNVSIKIMRCEDWVNYIFEKCLHNRLLTEEELVRHWLNAYTLSIAQRRRDIAPIDEPCFAWLNSLKNILARR